MRLWLAGWLAVARWYTYEAVMSVRDFIARYLTHRCPVCHIGHGFHKLDCYHVY